MIEQLRQREAVRGGIMKNSRRMLLVILDGVGLRESHFGNAVALARTPYLNYLSSLDLTTSLNAHGTYVGLPSDQDIGNSEVGHNTLGAGKVYSQGASLVKDAIESKSIFAGKNWQKIISRCLKKDSTLHFLGLLSDGNVHSHQDHLHGMLVEAHKSGVKKIRVHVLLDGRDVGEKTAEVYATALESLLAQLRKEGCDARVASGGGRMTITMDRYNADWGMVQKGWDIHVHGKGPQYASLTEAIADFRKDPKITDQYAPGFCIAENNAPVGPMKSGDSVILFNFRGDRAIEISQAFENKDFSQFERNIPSDLFFAGIMQYDGDLLIPKNYLVDPPKIDYTLSQSLLNYNIKQFACSETQKFGHVTYFWNGNRSGYLDKSKEEYLEIPSDNCPFHEKPWMKAYEITQATLEKLRSPSFQFSRINFANGDMVGHTGKLEAAIIAMETIDLMLGTIIEECKKTETFLVVTADHGNCDEMFDGLETQYPNWQKDYPMVQPKPKTSHTLARVPFYVYDPKGVFNGKTLLPPGEGSLANLGNTCLDILGLPIEKSFEASLLR